MVPFFPPLGLLNSPAHKPFATPGSPAFTEVLSCRTVYYTAPVAATPSRIEREVMALSATLSYLVEAAEQASRGVCPSVSCALRGRNQVAPRTALEPPGDAYSCG